jgi:hypothetical protein
MQAGIRPQDGGQRGGKIGPAVIKKSEDKMSGAIVSVLIEEGVVTDAFVPRFSSSSLFLVVAGSREQGRISKLQPQ